MNLFAEIQRAWSRSLVRLLMPNAEGPRDVVKLEHPPSEQYSRLVTTSRIAEDGETMLVDMSVTLRTPIPKITITVKS